MVAVTRLKILQNAASARRFPKEGIRADKMPRIAVTPLGYSAKRRHHVQPSQLAIAPCSLQDAESVLCDAYDAYVGGGKRDINYLYGVWGRIPHCTARRILAVTISVVVLVGVVVAYV